MTVSRRQFLGISAAASATTLASGISLMELAQAKPAAEEASNKQRWGLLIDTNKCSKGCTACVDACNTENGLKKSNHEDHDSTTTDAQWIRKLEVKDKTTGFEHSLPVMCQHCEEPPCVDVCPTGASMKREDGIVLVDKHICIGCRYCMMACPYKARSFIHEDLTDQKAHAPRGKGVVESCTLCVHKIDNGDGTTACAEACDKEGHQAILFGDLKDANSDIAKRVKKEATTRIRADLNLNTGIRYQGI
jgi:tetrathionate reductase subunit B